MNIAILSTAHVHTRGFLRNITAAQDGRKIAVIWDNMEARGREMAAEFNAAYSSNLDEVLADPAVDGFIICAENTRHLEFLERVLPLGKPVFCEKPLVTSLEDLARVKALLAGCDTPLLSGYFFPFTSSMQSVAAALKGKPLGDVTRVRYRLSHHAVYAGWFNSASHEWFTQPELAGGGAFMDLGTHGLHLLTSLFGPVAEVWACIENHTGTYPAVDDYGLAQLRFSSGLRGTLEAAWTQTGGPGGLEVVGSERTLYMEGTEYKIALPDQPGEPFVETAAARPDRVDRLVAIWRGEVSAEEQQADLRACIHAVEIMAAAYESARSGTWVKV